MAKSSGKDQLFGLAIFAALVVGFAAWLQSGPDQESGPKDCGDVSWRAPVRAEAYVKDILKSPRSAKFNDAKTYLMPSEDENLCIYTVTGTVDAQNAFGAMIRTEYASKVQYDRAADAWSNLETAMGE